MPMCVAVVGDNFIEPVDFVATLKDIFNKMIIAARGSAELMNMKLVNLV
ncbi:hypothetical protein ES703_86764 [subsurface metagenome]